MEIPEWPVIALAILILALWVTGMVAASRQSRRRRKGLRAARRLVSAALEVPPRVTVYGTEKGLAEVRESMAAEIHSCLVKFFKKEADDLYWPYPRFIAVTVAAERFADRVAIDVELCAGLKDQDKRQLLMALKERLYRPGVEIRLLETPGSNWMVDGRIPTEDGTSQTR